MKFGKRENAKLKEQHVRLPLLQLFPKYSQIYINLNVKK